MEHEEALMHIEAIYQYLVERDQLEDEIPVEWYLALELVSGEL